MGNFTYPVRVYAEDTDYGGIVYHSNYLNFFERARTEWLRSLGYEQDQLQAEDILFVVRSLQIDYYRPARFNELLRVETQVIQRNFASLNIAQSLFRDSEEKPLCTAGVKIVCVNTTLSPRPLPQFLSRKNNVIYSS